MRVIKYILVVVASLAALASPAIARAGDPDAEAIGRILGLEPATAAGGAVQVRWPRRDVPVRVDRMRVAPSMGLESWASFRSNGDDLGSATLVSDAVVFSDEINPAIDAALASGLKVQGIRERFVYDEPRVHVVRLAGDGTVVGLATAVKNVWDAVKRVRGRRMAPAESFPGFLPRQGSLDTAGLSRIVGGPGSADGAYYVITLSSVRALRGPAADGRGESSWAGFSGADAFAVVDGELVMAGAQVQPVLRALRAAGLSVTSLGTHSTADRATTYFVHFRGEGRAADLARGVRSAIAAWRMAGL